MKTAVALALCLFGLLNNSAAGNRAARDKPAPQASEPLRVSVKGDVMKKTLVRKVNPRYPEAAKQARTAGTVKLQVIVGVDGNVKQAEFISGPAPFVQPTIEAVRQWKYKPPKVNGHPVEVDTTVEVVFSLNQ